MIDHLFTIIQVTEKKTGLGQELHRVFVDLQKAYDSMPLVKLWEALNKSSFNGGLVNAIKEEYKYLGVWLTQDAKLDRALG